MNPPPLTREDIARLSSRIEHYVELEIGRKIAYVGLIYDPGAERFAVFTNRKSDEEVMGMLEEALGAIKRNVPGETFRAIEGEIQGG